MEFKYVCSLKQEGIMMKLFSGIMKKIDRFEQYNVVLENVPLIYRNNKDMTLERSMGSQVVVIAFNTLVL